MITNFITIYHRKPPLAFVGISSSDSDELLSDKTTLWRSRKAVRLVSITSTGTTGILPTVLIFLFLLLPSLILSLFLDLADVFFWDICFMEAVFGSTFFSLVVVKVCEDSVFAVSRLAALNFVIVCKTLLLLTFRGSSISCLT